MKSLRCASAPNFYPPHGLKRPICSVRSTRRGVNCLILCSSLSDVGLFNKSLQGSFYKPEKAYDEKQLVLIHQRFSAISVHRALP